MIGARIQPRDGNWRFACENGYDEGHAKYLHRTSLWRLFKPMPVWNKTRIVKRGRWIFRVQEKQYWDADFPGLGRGPARLVQGRPPKATFNIGNTGGHREDQPDDRGPASSRASHRCRMPGVLRIVYPTFIHYEFYVPGRRRQPPVRRRHGQLHRRAEDAFASTPSTSGAIRWLFHGQFSGQDKWMVEVTDAPPERLYRPDDSLLQWRKLAEDDHGGADRGAGQEGH